MGVPVFGYLAKKIFGTRNQRMVRHYLRIVDAANRLEPTIRPLTDGELRQQTEVLRKRLAEGATAQSLIPDVFAVAREAMDRSVGLRNIFDPALGFDPQQLPPEARVLYESVQSEIAATPARDATGELRGCHGPLAAWQFVDIPPALYEAVRALHPQSRPPFRARPFDVQLIGGIVLSEGRIAEMKTGEGKTIVAPLAAYLACLEKKQVHVVTVNEYLVQRDRDWTFPFFRALGLTVGAIHPFHMQSTEEKREAYQCDVVYGTTSEFGFDYLRDNMKTTAEDQVQRHRDYAIVDEVDSILIDEARTPLIISGPAFQVKPRYEIADRLAKHLVARQSEWNQADEAVRAAQAQAAGIEGDIRNVRDRVQVPALKKQLDSARKSIPVLEHTRDKHTQYYELEMDKKRASISHEGIEEAQREAAIGSFYVGENMDLPHLLEQAIRAHTVYQRDRDYVVAPDGEGSTGIVIVDQNTGRKMVGRQWSDGLHQAIESKEGVTIKEETQTMATVTIQNFFKLYKRLSGMTGTADTEATEFHEIYRLDVVSIPTNVPVRRTDRQDLVFLNQKDKWANVVEEIKGYHDAGCPVLVGTTSVEKSEMLSRMLTASHNLPHEVLNAKQHEREADIVAGAGTLGAVMIATNMAGRGTDIKLRSITPAQLIEHWKRRGIAPREADAGMSEDAVMGLVWKHLAKTHVKGAVAADAGAESDARLVCLRAWVVEKRDIAEKKAANMSASACEDALDRGGSFMLHRLRIFKNVEEMGGLHIVGTERHESRRIDNQLRGRSGRQGDQGASRFFLALDDDLMKMFAGKATLRLISSLGMREGDVMENPMLTRALEKAQRKVEERNFQIRKSILDYDEPMEHQRRTFYGMRQPVLESKGISTSVFSFIAEAVRDAADTFLSPMHAPRCISEWILENFSVSVEAERFKGLDHEEVIDRTVVDAIEEATTVIHTTAGEYMPDGVESAEWDGKGLADWAAKTYGAEVDAQAVMLGDREGALRVIDAAMERRFRSINLSPLKPMLARDFGAKAFLGWAKNKFGIDLPADTLAGTESVEDGANKVIDAARASYRQRERAYPIEFALEFTTANLQANPAGALAQFCAWCRARYQLDWQPESMPSHDPRELKLLLLAEAAKWDDAHIAARAAEIASKCPSSSAVADWLKEHMWIRISAEEQTQAGIDPVGFLDRQIREVQRSELTHFERWVLLQVFDQCWKDHLHAMDQLRDAIGFRAFSQKDPRIEFKKEAARLFTDMEVMMRDKVTDLVFKARMVPQVAKQPPNRPEPASGNGTPTAASQPSGAALTAAAAPAPTATQQRDQAIAQQSSAAETPAGLRIPKPKANAASAVGRNELCPCGSGKKFKHCHGAK